MNEWTEGYVRWLRKDEGGREMPPVGPVYSTVARFEEQKESWLADAWSLVIKYEEPPSVSQPTKVLIRFLAEGPSSFLRQGKKFELVEGSAVVAVGQVKSHET